MKTIVARVANQEGPVGEEPAGSVCLLRDHFFFGGCAFGLGTRFSGMPMTLEPTASFPLGAEVVLHLVELHLGEVEEIVLHRPGSAVDDDTGAGIIAGDLDVFESKLLVSRADRTLQDHAGIGELLDHDILELEAVGAGLDHDERVEFEVADGTVEGDVLDLEADRVVDRFISGVASQVLLGRRPAHLLAGRGLDRDLGDADRRQEVDREVLLHVVEQMDRVPLLRPRNRGGDGVERVAPLRGLVRGHFEECPDLPGSTRVPGKPLGRGRQAQMVRMIARSPTRARRLHQGES